MNKLKQLPLGHKVLLAFGLICGILLAIGGLFFFSLRAIERLNEDQQSAAQHEMGVVRDAGKNGAMIQAAVFHHIMASELEEITRHSQSIERMGGENVRKLAEYEKFIDTETERLLHARVTQAWKVYWEQTQPVLKLSSSNQDNAALAFALSNQAPAYAEYHKAVDKLTDYSEGEAREATTATTRFIDRTIKTLNLLVGATILIVSGTGLAVVGVARRLKEDNRILQTEVAERKRAEETLRESEEKFRQLAENIADVFWIASPDFQKVHYVSQAYQRVWARSADSLYTNPQQWIEAILPEERARMIVTFSKLAAGEPSVLTEFRIACPDGEVRWIQSSGFPVRDAAGDVIRITGIATDITERKRAESELGEAHKQLLDLSRQAGMAEVATNVLHNVGNVLNSVNVSAILVLDAVKKSKVSSLARVVALLREHDRDLGAFITSDTRGKQLPTYLAQLSDNLLADQETTVRELDSLRANIEHIKEIVAMQQNYAKVSGVSQIVNISELVEDSLRMNVGALARHRVEVIRKFENVPPMNVDRHKVLQILVNLVRNAKYACDESPDADRRLTVCVANGDDRVKISVVDNGVGIPPENLARIFNHGFTTRKDGHGFGLHSAALAAKEMGGSLTAHSDGPGKGAAFTLLLPWPRDQDSDE
jgi:PAS domain S-box-containing protein